MKSEKYFASILQFHVVLKAALPVETRRSYEGQISNIEKELKTEKIRKILCWNISRSPKIQGRF